LSTRMATYTGRGIDITDAFPARANLAGDAATN
jgi:hypothetical protein